MEVILDTSFILTCLKEKIDFLKAGEFGELVLPEQVIDEIKKLSEKRKGREKEIAMLAWGIIRENKEKFKIIELKGKHVDAGIKGYVHEKRREKVIVATLDKELKLALKEKARMLIIRGKRKIIIE